jgi:hypothetical protein
MVEDRLARARRHVEEGRRIVWRQYLLVAREKRSGRNTEASEALLRTFERSLAIFEADLRYYENKTFPSILRDLKQRKEEGQQIATAITRLPKS